MKHQRVQALGLTRWSYPFSASGFRRSDGGIDNLRAQLYAPQRLDHRLFLLEHVVLPGLRRQTDQDFTHLFLMGDQLPEPWRGRVLKLLKTVPQIIPLFRREGENHQQLCREIMLAHVDARCDATAQYRLDDDDGVGLRFVERTRLLFGDMIPFFDQSGKMALDFSRGFLLQTNATELAMHPVSMRFWAPGMVVFQRPDSDQAVLDFNHLKIWHYMPSLTWQEEPMFLRGAHHDNDSELASFGRRTRSFNFNHRNPSRFFARRFGLDLPEMKNIWSTQKDYFLRPADAGQPLRPEIRVAA